jgi:membrane protease YdiL (CAAX protease family)
MSERPPVPGPEEGYVPPSYQGYPPSYGAEPGQPAASPVSQPVSQPTPPPAPWAGYGAAPAPVLEDPRLDTEHPHPEPRSYALMLRTWSYEWWRPVVGILLLGIGGFVVVPILLLPVLAVGVLIEGGPFQQSFSDALGLKVVTPSAMLYLNLSLAALVLVAMAIERWLHRLRPRWLISVLPGVRWKFFFVCIGLAVVALVAQLVVGSLLPHDANDLTGHPAKITGTLVATGIVVLLTTPLQAMGEEFAFRGYLTQAFGSLFRSRVVAVVVPSMLFAFAHGLQNFPLFFDRFAFGLLAGFLVIKVGGLEAGIALHILNNLLAFGVAIAFGDIGQSLTVSHVSWWQVPLTVTQNGVYLLLVMYVAKRMGLRTMTAPPGRTEDTNGVVTGPVEEAPAGPTPIGN